jgi:hypothetical protein
VSTGRFRRTRGRSPHVLTAPPQAVSLVEHGASRTGRWLRARRIRIALWIAVVEGAFIVFHAISWPIALIVAIAVVVLYFSAGNRLRSDVSGQIAWIAAVSQALVMLVPVLVIVVGTLALIVVGALAVVALILLFSDRR